MKRNYKIGLIISYEEFYNRSLERDRLSYIKKYPKSFLIKCFSLINLYYAWMDHHRKGLEETQLKMFRLFSSNNLSFRIQGLEKIHALSITKKYKEKNSFPVIFNRVSNILALQEIIYSKDFSTGFDNEIDIDENDLFAYYLSVNSEVIHLQNNTLLNSDLFALESIVAALSPSHEHLNNIDPFPEALRGLHLISYLKKHSEYSTPFRKYFKEIGFDPEVIVLWILDIKKNLFAAQVPEEIRVPVFSSEQNEQSKILFEKFSALPDNKGEHRLEFLSIKKSPFYEIAPSQYILLDIYFLADKLYQSTINDFFFDFLKEGNSRISRRDHYMSTLGKFFEDYILKNIQQGFFRNRNKILSGQDLQVTIGRNNIELADLCILHNKKVILGQAKVSALASKHKYGENPVAFFKNEPEEFYRTFGLSQLVQTTIGNIAHLSGIETRFPKKGKVKIYPWIILNDRIFGAPAISLMFHRRFRKLLKEKFNFNIVIPEDELEDMFLYSRYIIKPLIILSIAEVEIISSFVLKDEKNDIWNILNKYPKKTGLQAPLYYYLLKTKEAEGFNYIREHYDRSLPFLKELEQSQKPINRL